MSIYSIATCILTAFFIIWLTRGWCKSHDECRRLSELLTTARERGGAAVSSYQSLAAEYDQLYKQIGAPKDTVCLPELNWYQDVRGLREKLKTVESKLAERDRLFHAYAKSLGIDTYPKPARVNSELPSISLSCRDGNNLLTKGLHDANPRSDQ